ncbi:MAG: NAD(P)-dependent alcohol dehydrogenase [Polyangiales bacterium]
MNAEPSAHSNTMRAAVYDRYGPPSVVSLGTLPKPVPKANEVLIRVHATTVSSADWRMRSLTVPTGFGVFARPAFGFFKPRKRVLGSELAGVVEAVGSGVSRFRVGDRVFAFPGFALGCHAEYRTVPEDGRIAPIPDGLSFEQAAALCFGGTTALHFLRDVGKVVAGESVLVVGASGTVGSAAVQIARHLGARVTATTSGANVERVRALGADHVIDYTLEDPLVAQYDVIFDSIGTLDNASFKRGLKPEGRGLLIAAGLGQIVGASWVGLTSKRKILGGPAPENPEHVRQLGELAAQGKFRPLIDRSFPLAEIVEAHTLVDSGRKRGSVIVTLD